MRINQRAAGGAAAAVVVVGAALITGAAIPGSGFATPPRKTAAQTGKAWLKPGVAHPGADQIWWVPTFTQALEMARVTGRPIFAVGHVSGWNGY